MDIREELQQRFNHNRSHHIDSTPMVSDLVPDLYNIVPKNQNVMDQVQIARPEVVDLYTIYKLNTLFSNKQ